MRCRVFLELISPGTAAFSAARVRGRVLLARLPGLESVRDVCRSILRRHVSALRSRQLQLPLQLRDQLSLLLRRTHLAVDQVRESPSALVLGVGMRFIHTTQDVLQFDQAQRRDRSQGIGTDV